MQIELKTLSDLRSETETVDIEPNEDRQRMGEDVPLELLLPYQMREPVAWPRVFPGL